jgi:peptidyl-prolyl cis-trans isomerase B (cyclophilin B)
MTPPRRRGRRIPPKGAGPRPVPPPLGGSGSSGSSAGGREGGGAGGIGAGGAGGAGMSAAEASAERARQLTRAQNRAAKRAASGVRPKSVRGGRVTGRRSRGYNPAILALAIAAVLIGAVVFLIGNPFGGTPSPSASGGATQGAVQSHGDGTCPTSQPASLSPGQVKTVTIETSKGTIVMRIDGSLAPIATGNFVALVACHFYDGIVFHRLVPGFVIQGGDPEGTGGGGPGYAIKDDPLNGTYHRGTVAMARTGQPDSQGSQFFIVLADDANTALTDPSNAPYPYAIMGEVTSGMDVVDAIAAMPNSGDNSGNQALDPVAMTSVTVSDAPTPRASPASATATPAASQ